MEKLLSGSAVKSQPSRMGKGAAGGDALRAGMALDNAAAVVPWHHTPCKGRERGRAYPLGLPVIARKVRGEALTV